MEVGGVVFEPQLFLAPAGRRDPIAKMLVLVAASLSLVYSHRFDCSSSLPFPIYYWWQHKRWEFIRLGISCPMAVAVSQTNCGCNNVAYESRWGSLHTKFHSKNFTLSLCSLHLLNTYTEGHILHYPKLVKRREQVGLWQSCWVCERASCKKIPSGNCPSTRSKCCWLSSFIIQSQILHWKTKLQFNLNKSKKMKLGNENLVTTVETS